MPEILTCRAITLSALKYRDYDQIITMFTDRYGLMKAMVHGALRPKNNRHIFCQPFTEFELMFRPKKQEIYSFQEGQIIASHLDIRNTYETMHAAMKLLNITQQSQVLLEPAPQLYLLLSTFLNKMTYFKNPYLLSSSYLLKVLLSSGAWTLQSHCQSCNAPLTVLYYQNNSYYCENCSPKGCLVLTERDIETMTELIGEKSFTKLNQVVLTDSLQEKIEALTLGFIES